MKIVNVFLLMGLAYAGNVPYHPSTNRGDKYLRGWLRPKILHKFDVPTNLTSIPTCTVPQAACSAADEEYTCEGASCWCNLTTEGEGLCFSDVGTCSSYKACATSTDCPSNHRCFDVEGCDCDNLRKVCSAVKSAVNGSCSF